MNALIEPMIGSLEKENVEVKVERTGDERQIEGLLFFAFLSFMSVLFHASWIQGAR